jgi:hypothetical protein
MNKSIFKYIAFLLLGIIISFAITTAIRFSNIKEETRTHFHANMAIFINGQKVDLSQDKYMQDVTSCNVTVQEKPEERAHFHNKNGDTVHVHADLVTWGALLSNINWYADKGILVDDSKKVYAENETNKLKFVLNGKVVPVVWNRLIASEDRLLINYGPESDQELLDTRFKEVKSDAHELNTKNDPASCSGSEHTELDFWGKFKIAVMGE